MATGTVVIKTNPPQGLGIIKNGTKYTFFWKITDKNYGRGQEFCYRTSSRGWKYIAVGPTQNAVQVTIADTQITWVEFSVRGRATPYERPGDPSEPVDTLLYDPEWSIWVYNRMSITPQMQYVKVATKAPTGLTITRKSNSFTIAWKIGDQNYAKGHELQYQLSNMNANSWISVPIGVTTTTKTITVDAASFYPAKSTTISYVRFRIRGCRGNYASTTAKYTEYSPQWSDWSIKTMDLSVPDMPSITANWEENPNNATTFTWNTTTQTDGAKHYVNVELQSILVKECNESDGSKLTWKSTALGWVNAALPANYSRTFTEDTALLADNSYTRWVRVRSRGFKGASAWRYAKHVYSKPYRATVTSATATATAARGYICNIAWEAPSNYSHPIDYTVVEHVIETPDNGLACPGGLSWDEAEISRDTAGKDKANFEVDDTVNLDECLWLRVNTHHDDNVTYGVPTRVRTGRLSDPEGLSASVPVSGYTATVTATNKSAVPDSFLVVLYRRINSATNTWEPNPMIVGIIPHGSTSTTVTCPSWSGQNQFAFGVYAAQGSYSRVARKDSITQYTVTANTTSANTIWSTETVPKAPEDVTLSETSVNGQILVKWSWSWSNADKAEISWSDTKNAWESTAGYKSYKTDDKTAKWYIPNLDMGKTWYVRVRLYAQDEVTPWSAIEEIDLAKAPDPPTLSLSVGRIAQGGNVTASWTYLSNDGTEQTFAELQLCEVQGDDVTLLGLIAHAGESQAVILYPEALGLEPGNSYTFVARTTSASGKKSDWSNPATVEIASPLNCVISNTSLEEVTVIEDVEEEEERTVLALTQMPLTLTVEGAGEGGVTSVYIERAESYYMDRPDETEFNGHEGETIAVLTQNGEDEITFGLDNLIGYMDDGAKYRIVATVNDDLGQSDTTSLDFEVRWEHQAIMPSADILIDNVNYVAQLTPIAPSGALEDDVCDIYRLSADKPELVVENGLYGTTYVDPYPTLNEHGGHRFVFKTANGDYITAENKPAWVDYTENEGDKLEVKEMLIDFAGEQISLPYNLAISSSWAKDFTETMYLGGSIQGDWNKAVKRSASVNTTSVAVEDPITIKKMRRLAAYPGICHVRTPEGSSYAADIQVSESMTYEKAGKLAEFSLAITKVDAEGLDGVTLVDWEVEE